MESWVRPETPHLHRLQVAEVPDARRQRPGQAVVGHLSAAPTGNETKQNSVNRQPTGEGPGSEVGARSVGDES